MGGSPRVESPLFLAGVLMVDVVLVHAFPFDGRLWDATARALADGARVWSPDLPGFGRSTAAPAHSVEEMAEAVRAYVDARGIDRFVLGGMSMGGYVAFAWVRRFGTGRLRGLVLADTRVIADDGPGRRARNDTIDLVRREGLTALADRQLPKMFVDPSTPVARQAHRWMLEQPVATTTAALEALRDRPDSTPVLARIDVPALVVCGAQDVVSPPDEMRGIAERIGRARYVEIPSAGHLAHLEQPVLFHSALAGFVRDLR